MRPLPFSDFHPTLPSNVVISGTDESRDYRLEVDGEAAPDEAIIIYPKRRFFDEDRPSAMVTVTAASRRQHRTSAAEQLRALVERVLQRVKAKVGECDIWLALPALSDNKRLDAYRKLLKDVCLDIVGRPPKFIYEPDAVIQYLRLSKPSIKTARNQLQTYLVIDAGAGTTNIAVTFKPIARKAHMGTMGRHRGKLQPITADAPTMGGLWVDDFLLRRALEKVDVVTASSLEDAQEARNLKRVQLAKINVSTSGTESALTLSTPSGEKTTVLTVADLESASAEYAKLLRTHLEGVLHRTFAQLASDSGPYRASLERKGVRGRDDVSQLFDYIVFAGGSSRLPGFQRQIMNILGTTKAEVITAASEYEWVVAAGLGAHALERLGSAAAESDVSTGEPELPDWLKRVVESDIAGIARLPQNLAVLYHRAAKGENPKARICPAVFTHDFPLNYEPPKAPRRTDWEVQNQKNMGTAAQSTFAVIASDTDSATRLYLNEVDESAYQVLAGAPPDPRRMRHAHKLRKKNHVLASYDSELDSVRLEVLSEETPTSQGLVIEVFLDDPQDQRQREFDRLVRWWKSRSGETKSTTTAPPDYRPTVCIDIGTSKVVAVVAEPGFEFSPPSDALNDGDASEEREPSPEGPTPAAPIPKARPAAPSAKAVAQVVGRVLATQVKTSELRAIQPTNKAHEAVDAANSLSEIARFEDKIGKLESPLPSPAIWENEADHVRAIHGSIEQTGLLVSLEEVANLYLSAKVSPLVALAGPPGMGKSTLARAFFEALGMSSESGTLARVAVEARWNDSSHLMAGGSSSPEALGDFAKVAYRSTRRKNELFGVVLDEWNLAQVDYYLSHVVSALSDDGSIPLAAHPDGNIKSLPLCPPEHRLLVLATMNADEAGTPLTEKVLDRTTVLEFLPFAAPARISTRIKPIIRPAPISASEWRSRTTLPEQLEVPPAVAELWKLFAETGMAREQASSSPFVLSYRVLRDMVAFLHHAEHLGKQGIPELNVSWALDRLMLQRVLPRIQGETGLRDLLERLHDHAETQGYARSAQRLHRMKSVLERHHVTSFWAT